MEEEELSIDNIIINLKMLSQIKQNDKLYTEGSQFRIDSPKFSQGILRWFNDYSREKTMDDIDVVVKHTEVYISSIFENSSKSVEDNRMCQNILLEITRAIDGLQNLKLTYKDDTFVQSRLDVAKEKFNVCKNNLSQKLEVS